LQPRNGCDGRLTAKILPNTNEMWRRQNKFNVIKIFAISLPFLGHHLGFHILFNQASKAGCCQFKIWVEQVCKNFLKPFPNGLYGCKTAEKEPSWPSRLPGSI